MEKNIRTKIQLKEEIVSQITLNDLLDLGSKAQIAVIQLADQCMKFDNPQLRKISAEVNKQVALLCDQIKAAIINDSNMSVDGTGLGLVDKKSPLDVPGDTPKRHGDNNRLESVQKKKKSQSIIKKLLEALNEATDEDVEDEETIPEVGEISQVEPEKVEETETTEEDNSPKIIDLSSAFSSVIDGLSDEQFADFKSQVVNSLKGSGITDPAFQEKVSEIENAENVDDFNFALDSIYDYADDNGIEVKAESDSEPVEKTKTEIVTESKQCKCKTNKK